MKSRLVLASFGAMLSAALVAGPVAAERPTGCPGHTTLILVAMLDPLTEIVGPGDANGNGHVCGVGARTGSGAMVLIDDLA